MARLPDETAFGARPTPRSARPQVSIRAGVAEDAAAAAATQTARAGQQLAAFGEDVAAANEVIIKAERAATLAATETEGVKRLKEFEASLEGDPDFGTKVKRFDAFKARTQAELAGSISHGPSRAAFLQNFERSSLTSAANIGSSVRASQIDSVKSLLTVHQDEELAIYGQAKSEAERSASRERFQRAQNAAVSVGAIKRDDAAKNIISFGEETELIDARKALLADPVQFQEDIPNPANFPNLDESDRQRLVEEVDRKIDADQRRAASDADKLDRQEEKDVKSLQDVQGAVITQGIIEGTVSAPDIQDALDDRSIDGRLGTAAFKFLDAKNKDALAIEDNPHAVLNLTAKAEAGTLTLTEILNEAALGHITLGRMDKLRAEIERAPDNFEVIENRDALRNTIVGIGGPYAPMSIQDGQRLQGAKDRYNQLVRRENVSPRLARRQVEAEFSSPVEPNVLPRPRFLVGDDNEGMDPVATKAATNKAFRIGTTSRKENLRQLRMIDDIVAAQNRVKAQ